ncbi:uncharacterized protein LOC125233043 [Leguminivora glycinivorella]|uniref:uncharacterized protein LOC125233043 n=1 Tax=Leguminivora glycinivorella TaxID=1035111 RepID=UPI00200C686C|nr:uncharacterized protein LOC125233043 [Leguminivora glycinivorella]
MADDDEIDVLGDFSFNSCLAQNNQGIPSCSSREDTVHPQWLLDSTVANWYDNEREKRAKYGPSRKLSGDSRLKQLRVRHSSWSQAERDLLSKEMAKYGRNFHKISQTIKSKSAAEVQALIEAEYGVNLDNPSVGVVKHEEEDDVPSVGQEEIVTDDSSINSVLSRVTTASPTIMVPKKPFRKKNNNVTLKSLKPALHKPDLIVNPSEIYYEDELVIGSTESVGSLEPKENHAKLKAMAKQQKEKMKAVKKIGNHRRKASKNFEKGRARTSSKELLKSPQERRRKDSGVSEESLKSPKLQIVLGSGQALHVSEGEQVIKIEKKKDSESDSDIEVDIDSDTEKPIKREGTKSESSEKDSGSTMSEAEAPIAVPLNNFGLPPKRQKKIVLDGGGGYTIAHTAAGDVLQRRAEPRRPSAPRARQERLIPCRVYNTERPAPYSVVLSVSALVLMDAHAHSSLAEVMGLLGGRLRGGELELRAYRAAAAAAGTTHCDMDPVSQAAAGAWLHAQAWTWWAGTTRTRASRPHPQRWTYAHKPHCKSHLNLCGFSDVTTLASRKNCLAVQMFPRGAPGSRRDGAAGLPAARAAAARRDRGVCARPAAGPARPAAAARPPRPAPSADGEGRVPAGQAHLLGEVRVEHVAPPARGGVRGGRARVHAARRGAARHLSVARLHPSTALD